MDFGMLPPEINSGRMYAGAGSEPMLTAAAAWDALAAQLHSTAASYFSVISGLTTDWQGPSSAAMAGAAAPYAAWMRATAAQAEQTAAQARAAAAAYTTAFAATVPPPLIAANRAATASLVATNIVGQNTPAIAATEAHYAEMWAQDAAAMYGYAGQSATAAQLTPFSPPPQTTDPGAATAQSAAVVQNTGASAGAGAQSTLSRLTSAAPASLQSLAAPAAADPPSLDSLLPLVIALELFEGTGSASLPSRNALASSTIGFGLSTRGFQTGELPVPLVPGILFNPTVDPVETASAASAASAGVGRAGVVGALSVPPSWATATPTIRLAAAALQGVGPDAAPLVAAGEGSVFGQMALGSLAGGALGGAVPRVATAAGARAAATGTEQEDSKNGTNGANVKDGKTSDKLKDVLAELQQKPEAVQHWHTDKTHLESLLEQLTKKPGVHAVHVSSGNKPNATPPRPRWG